jgi:hypothetical protein
LGAYRFKKSAREEDIFYLLFCFAIFLWCREGVSVSPAIPSPFGLSLSHIHFALFSSPHLCSTVWRQRDKTFPPPFSISFSHFHLNTNTHRDIMRKLKFHEQKLLRKVDFLKPGKGHNIREAQVLRRYLIERREDYVLYELQHLSHLVTQETHLFWF